MKIVYTSDLHVDISENNKKVLPLLLAYLSRVNPEIFIFAGDLANTTAEIRSVLSEFKKIKCLKIFVPGNHDLWIESKRKLKNGFDSSYKYEEELSMICSENGFVYPIFEPYCFDETAIISTVGWYDYSLRDKRLDSKYRFADYDIGEFGKMFWCDFKSSIWLVDRKNPDWKIRSKKMKNNEIFKKIFNQFCDVCSKVPPEIKKIIIVMHMSPFESCVDRKEEPDPFDAYKGSEEYGKFIENNLKNKNVTIFCGHEHKKLDLKINSNIRVLRAPFGYLNHDIENLNQLFIEKIGLLKNF